MKCRTSFVLTFRLLASPRPLLVSLSPALPCSPSPSRRLTLLTGERVQCREPELFLGQVPTANKRHLKAIREGKTKTQNLKYRCSRVSEAAVPVVSPFGDFVSFLPVCFKFEKCSQRRRRRPAELGFEYFYHTYSSEGISFERRDGTHAREQCTLC